MLLIKFTINSTLHRISQEGIALEHYWDAKVMAFTPPKYAMDNRYGGYIKPSFGQIALFPDLFDSDWPPPINCGIIVYYTATTEAAAEIIFQGEAHLRRIDREQIIFDLWEPSFTAGVSASTAFTSTTLVAALTTLCGASYLNLTLDTTYARSPSPTINHTTSEEQLAIDLASGMAKYCSHLIEIKDTNDDGILDTLYLVDMFANRGSRSLDEFEFFPSSYAYNPPPSLARDSVNGYVSVSSYPYGDEVPVTPYDDNQTNIEAALADIIDILVKPRMILTIPFEGNIPSPGEQITTIDESQGSILTAIFNARALTFDFDNEEIIIEGEGALT